MQTSTRILGTALTLVATLACAAAVRPSRTATPRASAPADTTHLRGELEAVLRGYPGVAGVSVIDLKTGERLSIRGDETYPSASLIKVAVLVTLLDEVNKGTIRLDERMSLLARDRVGGSGVLQYMGSGLNLTVGDAAYLMITLSDNTATNILLDHLDVKTVWAKMEALGLPHTKIHSKTFRLTTPNETARLFEMLYRGRAVSPAMDSLAIEMLKQNQDFTKLVRWLPDTVSAAHKTGEVDQARSDCGIVYAPQNPFIACVMTRENRETSYAPDNPANLLMARVGLAVFRHYNPGVPVAEPRRF